MEPDYLLSNEELRGALDRAAAGMKGCEAFDCAGMVHRQHYKALAKIQEDRAQQLWERSDETKN